VPEPDAGTGYAVEEFARRHGDYAICGVMAAARADAVRLVHFGIASLPIVTEVGAEDDVRARVREALEDVDVADDLHGTARYRRHLAEVLGERAAARAAVRAA
jgi:CO/xanthine dehydrogenase FAD-binding subunit